MMNQIQHLECEIAEYKIEIERHYQSILNLTRIIDKAEKKLEFLRSK